MISPTVGRVVHYHDKAISPEPLCALIAGVVDQKRVNLTVFDSQGNYAGGHPMIPLIQDGEEVPDGPHCSWMAFQKGQASKNDNLEPRLNAVEEAL